jgi:hypothetical protein
MNRAGFHRAAMMRLGGRENAVAGEAFWRFSLALYARPGVAEALIALQFSPSPANPWQRLALPPVIPRNHW